MGFFWCICEGSTLTRSNLTIVAPHPEMSLNKSNEHSERMQLDRISKAQLQCSKVHVTNHLPPLPPFICCFDTLGPEGTDGRAGCNVV